MGLLDELDLTDVPDDPNAIPNGTYRATLSAVKPYTGKPESKRPGKKGLIFEYTITDENAESYNGAKVSESKNCDPTDSPRDLSWLKQRLTSLGVPAYRQNDVEAEDLIGTEVRITTKMNTAKDGNTYCNVQSVVVDDGESVSSFGGLD